MRALTLWRPWPWAIFHAPDGLAKRIENRSWAPWPAVIGQVIALHAGKKYDFDGTEHILAILGLASIPGDIRWLAEGIVGTARVTGYTADAGALHPDQRRWWSGPYAWILNDVKALQAPIPCKGKQGLWVVPPLIENEIRRAS